MIDWFLYVTIFFMSILIGIAYILNDYYSILFAMILTTVLILYAKGNKYIQNLLHSCKWL